MSRGCRGFALSAVVAVLLAVAADVEALDAESFKAARAAAVARLTAKGTADALATAAVLEQFGEESDTGAYALVSKAVELAPDRRDLAWLAVRLCDTAPECNPAMSERHLQEVDPANAAGFLGGLSRARMRNDVSGVDAALVSIGRSERLDVYFNPLVVATATEAAQAHHPGVRKLTARDQAEVQVEMIGVIAATALAPLEPISQSCKGLALKVEGRLERCRRAAEVFARADTFIAEGLGLSLLQRLWPEESPEGQAIASRRRVFQYRLEEYNRLAVASSSRIDPLAASLELRRTHEREQDTALEYLRKAGLPIDPPPGWQSQQPPRVP